MREAIANEAKLAFFDILLDRVQEVFFLDLEESQVSSVPGRSSTIYPRHPNAHLHLAISPARDFDDHVQDCLLLVGKERNVVPRRYWLAILL